MCVPFIFACCWVVVVYSLLIKNGRRIISSTVLFSPVVDYSKWRITQRLLQYAHKGATDTLVAHGLYLTY